MTTLSELILTHSARIEAHWLAAGGTAAHQLEALRHTLPSLAALLARADGGWPPGTLDAELDYALLERCVYQAWAETTGASGWPTPEDAARLHRAILEAESFRLHDEQTLRDQFVETLAHDLRGPLTVALTGARLLAQRLGEDDLRYMAARIVQSVRRADGMLRDLLDVSRVTAGQKLPLDIDEVDLSQVVRQVVEELVLCYGPRFQLRLTDEMRGHWCAKELRRAVWNLLSNSIKHGRPDRPIAVRMERLNEVVRLEVHNHGSPIPPTAMRQIFEPFQRAGTPTTFTPGWGLGLTLVRACMEAHGGSVEVRSLPEEGTTFTLLLPPDSRPYYFGETHAQPMALPVAH